MGRLGGKTESSVDTSAQGLRGVAVAICLVLLSLMTVFNQVKAQGLSWQEEHYWPRLVAASTGEAPPRYFVPSALGVGVASTLAALYVPRPIGVGLVLTQLALVFLVLSLGVGYARRLGVPVYAGLLGASALAWGLTHAHARSGLDFEVYAEAILFLAAVLMTKEGGWVLTVGLAFIALPSGTAALLLLAVIAASKPRPFGRKNPTRLYAGLGLLLVAVAFGRALLDTRDVGAGLDYGLFVANLTCPRVWGNLACTVGVVPLLALISIRAWPPALKRICVTLLPCWFVWRFFSQDMSETQYVLLPQCLVFIPGALCGLVHWRARLGDGSDEAALS